MNFLNSFSNFSKFFADIKSSLTSFFTIAKLGQDIDGEAASDWSGRSVSMNAVGDRVAIGAIYNDGNGDAAGHVRIYSWSGTSWIQLGADIDGEAISDSFGRSVSMNAVGDRVAIGAIWNDGNGVDSGHVRIYSWSGTSWIQLGADINGELSGDLLGWSVSMNAAGDRVAIGATANDGNGLSSGHVRIYSWNGTSWIQLGADIDGEAASDESGYSISMNAVGDRVAIGAIYNDGSGVDAGHVRIYSWSGTAWTQLGADIDGEAAGDYAGSFVSMNAVGDRVAIGATRNDGNGNNAGHVRVYSWNGTSWTQMGADIDAEAANDSFGRSVAMNAVGDRVAIGSIGNDGNGLNSGHVRVYSWNGTSWTQMGADIDGEAAGDQSGFSVSMNGVGNRVAIGAPYNAAIGIDTGQVRVYSIEDLTPKSWKQLGANINGKNVDVQNGYSIDINHTGDKIAIGASEGTTQGFVGIYSWNGTAWTQLGSDIMGGNSNMFFGRSVSINGSGNTVAIGAPIASFPLTANPSNFRGLVRVYSWNGTTWNKLGADIFGEIDFEYFGTRVKLNMAGNILAVSTPHRDVGTDYGAGYVKVYSWNGTAWTQLGASIFGVSSENSGKSLAINHVGNRIAIGSYLADGGPGTNSGRVRIYSWNGTAWTQLGTDINGKTWYIESGTSVAMNAVGDKVAIGAPKFGSNRGQVSVYSWDGTAWTQMGSDIVGEAADDQSGWSVSMNAVGDKIIIGAPYNDGGGISSGSVRIYSWNGTSWTQIGIDIDGNSSIDEFGSSVSMNAAGDIVAIGAPKNDTNGTDSGHVKIYQLK